MNRLRELRQQKHFSVKADLSRTELSKRTGISTSMIESIEIGRRNPGIKTLIALADYFDVSIDYLVGRSDVR
ncbi:helix-turn-helix transcriptional regulator [Leuconostoc mesenteroides]|uniref:helix-turn-helix domain-containing protein n=1 Tax=Leuconostoc mesenteroides TaxID=1245 RepID=UPI001C689919|nr:helix-turn-helix transcriptional regulator [Leuconostoc mesenteroides]MCJ2160621.1 helix-turn-helix domain-containing protein [Leuconostoc mesenteroides]MCM6836125.1 helix-turn-helix domain-containing protein [Leuconostoc mesenteroides]WMS39431.1 helix-turn-helix transcriptional regulator [Leuconostoc mesenteroides]